MASSPPAPLHTSLSNPKKRPSLGPPLTTTSGGSPYAIKRPKLHPLRQTSYPDPNAIPFSATPSARSETGSLVSGISSRAGTATTTGEKRRRGRPKKGEKEREALQAAQDGSQSAGGTGGDRDDARTLISARSGPGGQGSKSVVSGRSGDEEDEGDGVWAAAAVTENLDAADKARKEEEDKQENLKLLRLMSTFTPEQEHRYRMFKRTALSKTQMKRIVNQTVSQSVTALPLIAIGAYSKLFVGEIITRALDVQKEWAMAFEDDNERESERKRDREHQLEREREDERNRKRDDEGEGIEHSAGDLKAPDLKAVEAKMKRGEFVPNPHKGGLLPDHLREALRRYKGDGEGGGVGFGSTSLGMMGTQGAGTWRVGGGAGARRLFR